MLDHYLLLRRPRAGVGELGSSAGRGMLRIDEVEVRTGQTVPSAATDPTIVAAAPVIPTTLLHPIPSTVAAGGAIDSWGLDAIGIPDTSLDGTGVDVAILDTGIDSTHEAFDPRRLVERSFVHTDDALDPNGHGTHCAGTFFGGLVSGTRIGVAPKVRRAFVGTVLDADGSGSTSSLFHGLHWAFEQGASVTSVSIGLDFSGVVDELLSQGYPQAAATSAAVVAYVQCLRQFEAAAASYAIGDPMGRRMVIVAATGNESLRGVDPRFRVGASPIAACPAVIAVGAVRRATPTGFAVADFSNDGADVCAPGVDITSAAAGGTATSMSGTSMATPFVAGAAALWAQSLGPGAAAAGELRARLIGTARLDPGLVTGERDAIGSGLLVAPPS